MPTQTQINFRKQMKEYQKEVSEDREKVFSYIENDMISDYYTIKPKRTYKRSVPVAAIILIIITVGVRVYNFIHINSTNTSVNIAKAISSISQADLIQTEANRKSQELYSYLSKINALKLKQNELITEYNKAVSSFNNGIITQKGLSLSIENMINRLDNLIIEYEAIEEIEEMHRYHSLFRESIHLQNSLFKVMLMRQKTGKAVYSNDISEILSKIDAVNAELKEEMIKRFEEFGIEYYYNSDGGITYTIRY